MILGIGVDMVENQRLVSWLTKPGLLAKYFTERERADVAASTHPTASLAARFAAKEAFGKALGIGLHSFRLLEIETRRGSGGRPELHLTGKARRAMDDRQAQAHLSITHEAAFSLAFVVLEVV